MLSSLSWAANIDSLKVNRDVQENLTVRIVEGKIYFNLTMINESKPGVYSLVKTYSDGTFESVGIKDIAVNTINHPLLYCFMENDIPKVNVVYKLIRISFNVETVQTWKYYSIQNKISDYEMLAVEANKVITKVE